jgi:hypothetical protein
MPVLQFNVSYDPKDFDNSTGQLAGEVMPIFAIDGATPGSTESLQFPHDLIVTNDGLGHARLESVDVVVNDNRGSEIETARFGHSNLLIRSGARRDIRMYFVAPRNNPRFGDPTQNVYGVILKLRFSDLLGNTYTQVVHTSFAKGLSPGEDPLTGGRPYSSFGYAEPAVHASGTRR